MLSSLLQKFGFMSSYSHHATCRIERFSRYVHKSDIIITSCMYTPVSNKDSMYQHPHPTVDNSNHVITFRSRSRSLCT
jgi:hypothetical protein